MTYPKDGERKLKEENKQLRMQVGRLRKENQRLLNEIQNIMKPVRPRKEHKEDQSPKVMTQEEWRQDFVNRFRPVLEKSLRESKKDGEEES